MVREIIANDLYELLDFIRTKPGLFLGKKSITALNDFIQGYQTACLFKKIQEVLNPDFYGFHKFVNDYYLHGPSTAGWKNVILAEHYGNEEPAFDDFFKLLDLFRAGYPQVNSKKIILHLIQKMIDDQKCLSLIDDNNIVDYLKKLPSRLEEGQSLYDYDIILYDIKEMASKNEMLSRLITQIAGSDNWLKTTE